MVPENLIYIDQKESSEGYPDFDWILPEGVEKYYTMYFIRNLEEVNHKHSYDEGVKTAPTCTQEGYTTYTCSCGETYNSDYVDTLEHSFTKQIVEDEYIKTGATCSSPAEYFFACEDCSAKGD
ncbi:MAG: hypothetical protein IJA16_01585, partial [Clostridia bacterium]|nr:hypothetical protein [Clostridia bacterium]